LTAKERRASPRGESAVKRLGANAEETNRRGRPPSSMEPRIAMKDPKSEIHQTVETIERVRSFLDRRHVPSRDKPRRDAILAGSVMPSALNTALNAPPFFNLTQHYVKAYFGPTTETLEALPPGMFLQC
jgi:hypothetical protein